MSFNYTLKYRTFEQMMAEVAIDFSKYELEQLISPEQLIKVVKRVNYDLGLRILKTKEELLDVEKGRVKLPNDFYSINFALICNEIEYTTSTPQGTFIDERLITPYQEQPQTDVCDPPQINCRTTVAGCTCGCNDACGCAGDCNNLCPQCSSENTLCNSETVTTTTTQNPAVVDPVRSCYWFAPRDYVGHIDAFSIDIDGTVHMIDPDDITTLNNLGLGSFYSVVENFDRYMFGLGSNVYGDVVFYEAGNPIYTASPVCTTVTTYQDDSRVCQYIMNKKVWDAISDWSITIDGVPNVISTPAPTLLTELNALNLGAWTSYVTTGNALISMIVTGDHIYGDFTYGPGAISLEQICTDIQSTPGTVVTEVVVEEECYSNPPTCKPRVVLDCKDNEYELVQVVNPSTTYTYKKLMPLRILQNSESIECGCPNLYISSQNTAWIKDGFLYTNFPTGRVYINYQGLLEDDDHNLLVPDHDGLNDYYEYAIKSRILENLIMNDEPVGKKIELIEMRLKSARLAAKTLVNMPNFAEMKDLWWANRRAQYAKYYDMFKSFNWARWSRNPNLDFMDDVSNNS